MKDRQPVYVRGLGAYLPEKILTNADLEKIVDTSDEWITSRTGIKERRIAADDQYTSDLSAEAAKRALADGGLAAGDVDAIIVATVTPDMPFPSTAAFVQKKIGAHTCPCMGIEAGCSGVPYGCELASALLRQGPYRNILAISADKLTAITDWQDRLTCVLFGDGAAAFLLTCDAEGARGEILDIYIANDSSGVDALYLPGGGSRAPATEETVRNRLHFLKMNGQEVYKEAVKSMGQAVATILERNNLVPDQIKFFSPHQANLRIIDAMARQINVPLERFLTVLQWTGNNSSPSVGIALDDAVRAGRLQHGDLVVLVSFGAGLTSGTVLLRWIG
ncbi:MAG: ketoacyl-ACP synthase III [Puniceicoccales bacterium]|jgi:3-oxoacyl-[acyl-carrier-protein] synthase-3|nr:ketoacyl-ACP synthase III [Puniceicoccales bacterium]